MTPKLHNRELLFWAIFAAAILTASLARECLGDELPPYPEGFEIEDEHGDILVCFYHEQEQIFATAYAIAHYCRRDSVTMSALLVEVKIENDVLRQKLRVHSDKLEEHRLHAETVEHLLVDQQKSNRKERLKSVVKTVALVALGAVAVGLGGALVWEKLDD